MYEVTLIGIDLGKHSFHLHAQDAAGRMVFRKKQAPAAIEDAGERTSSQITTAAPGTARPAGQSHRMPSPTAQPTPANPPPPAAPIGLEVSHPLQLRPRISADGFYF